MNKKSRYRNYGHYGYKRTEGLEINSLKRVMGVGKLSSKISIFEADNVVIYRNNSFVRVSMFHKAVHANNKRAYYINMWKGKTEGNKDV